MHVCATTSDDLAFWIALPFYMALAQPCGVGGRCSAKFFAKRDILAGLSTQKTLFNG